MSSGGEQKTQETTTETGLPAWAQPYVKETLSEGQRLYNADRPLYGTPTYMPDEAMGLDAIRGIASDPFVTEPAAKYGADVIRGDYLDPDRLRMAAAPAIGQALQGVGQGFEAAGGRPGGSMEAIATGEGVTRALAPFYAQERGLQQQAALAAPSIEAGRLGPAQALMSIGGFQQGREQERYDEPYTRLARYSALVGNQAPLAGTVATQQTPYYEPSPFQRIAGLGMAGAGLAGKLGWSPFG